METPDALESQVTLRTAVARYELLRTRDSFAEPAAPDALGGPAAPDAGGGPGGPGPARPDGPAQPGVEDPKPLSRDEALELLALGEVIARKAGYGRQLAVRTARSAGASWSEIGRALGTSKQTAWEAHNRWIDQQVRHNRVSSGHEGLTEPFAAWARALAGAPEDDEL